MPRRVDQSFSPAAHVWLALRLLDRDKGLVGSGTGLKSPTFDKMFVDFSCCDTMVYFHAFLWHQSENFIQFSLPHFEPKFASQHLRGIKFHRFQETLIRGVRWKTNQKFGTSVVVRCGAVYMDHHESQFQRLHNFYTWIVDP